jgi:hypothetical protein
LFFPAPVTVSGVATDAAGRPIPGVRVEYLALPDELAAKATPVETDANGRFRFQTLGPAVVFRKEAYETQLVRIAAGQAELHVVMAPAPAPEQLPACAASPSCISAASGRLCLPKVRKVEVGPEEVSGTAMERAFTVQTPYGPRKMTYGAGSGAPGPNPRARDIWSAVEYKERIHESGGVRVTDVHGKTANGRAWRYFGLAGESASYSDLDRDAAALLDRVLDGVCVKRK